MNRVFLAVLGVCGALLLLEAGLRLSVTQSGGIIEEDPFITRRTKANLDVVLRADGGGTARVRTNAHGFADDADWTLEKPAGLFRIAHLGDSFTAGHDVDFDKNYTVLLEGLLNETLRASAASGTESVLVESLNFGVPGQGTAHQFATFEHYARQFDPDAVLVWFFFGNDFEDNLVHEEGVEGGENGGEPALKRFARKSELARFAVYRLSWIPFFARIMHGRMLTRVGHDTLGDAQGLPLTLRLVFAEDGENARALERTEAYLAALKAAVGERRLLVVGVPRHFQTDSSLRAELLANYTALAERGFDHLGPNRELARITQALGIAYFDLTPTFAARCEGKGRSCPLYLCADCHFAPEGHRIAAQEVAEEIVAHWFRAEESSASTTP